ncbi:MAG: crotonase/enoyl-CoA hydratase family protein [Paracoccaceae bacterium]
MNFTTVKLDIDYRGVATITLNRPNKHNALSSVMISELTDICHKLGADMDVRVVVVAGAGKSFCSGGDLSWMQEQMSATRAVRISEARKIAEMLNVFNLLPKPVIGKIHGNAFGGGVGLISVCDIVISSKNAKFGLTETKLGLIPATISPYVIARMGEGKARQVFMSARIFDCNKALELGLISDITDDLDTAVEGEISLYLSAAPQAIAAAKALARSLGPKIDAEVIDDTIKRLVDTWEQAEAVEGVSAFFEKRKPNWQI